MYGILHLVHSHSHCQFAFDFPDRIRLYMCSIVIVRSNISLCIERLRVVFECGRTRFWFRCSSAAVPDGMECVVLYANGSGQVGREWTVPEWSVIDLIELSWLGSDRSVREVRRSDWMCFFSHCTCDFASRSYPDRSVVWTIDQIECCLSIGRCVRLACVISSAQTVHVHLNGS